MKRGLFLVFVLVLGCADGGTGDAGVDAGPTLPEGGSLCEDGRTCTVGTHCQDDTCDEGCFVDAQCRDDEHCDGVSETTVGRCEPDRTPTCGNGTCDLGEGPANCAADCTACPDEDGTTPCGDTTCAAGTYCLDPAAGSCETGCLSQSHCGCGTGCGFGLTASPIGTCQDPHGNPPECGDGQCNGTEGPGDCPADCGTWAEQCGMACSFMAQADCFATDQEAFMCQQTCANTDEQTAQSFAACVGMAGAQTCPTACLDLL